MRTIFDFGRMKIFPIRTMLIVALIVNNSCQPSNNIKYDKSADSLINTKAIELIDSPKINKLFSLDTLQFNENMRGSLLDEKYRDGKSSLSYYKKFILKKDINKLRTIIEKDTKSEISYLGELRDLTINQSYHIVTNFKIIGIGTILSPRGQSEVAFINEKQDSILIYSVNMPKDLPKFIENEVLYFQPNDSLLGITISGGLPPFLCVPKLGCYY